MIKPRGKQVQSVICIVFVSVYLHNCTNVLQGEHCFDMFLNKHYFFRQNSKAKRPVYSTISKLVSNGLKRHQKCTQLTNNRFRVYFLFNFIEISNDITTDICFKYPTKRIVCWWLCMYVSPTVFHAQTDKGGFKFWGKSIQLHLKSGTPDSLSRTGLTETRGNNTYW